MIASITNSARASIPCQISLCITMLFRVFQCSIAAVFIITVFEINEHFVSADLGELLATKDGEGGQEGQNLSGTFGDILKKGDDLSKSAKSMFYFWNISIALKHLAATLI